MSRTTEYEHLYAFKNKETGNYLLTYWASSQKHKALFSSLKKAEEARKNIDDIDVELAINEMNKLVVQ